MTPEDAIGRLERGLASHLPPGISRADLARFAGALRRAGAEHSPKLAPLYEALRHVLDRARRLAPVDKRTAAVVRTANARRDAKAPLLAWGGLVQHETLDDRLALRVRVQSKTYWTALKLDAADAAHARSAQWYAYLCSLHPAAPPGIFDKLTNTRWSPPTSRMIRARQTYAKLLEGIRVDDDFTVHPAPWLHVSRKHWRRLDVPAAQRRADEAAEVEAWQAAHPDEADAWERQRRARAATRRDVTYHDKRYAG